MRSEDSWDGRWRRAEIGAANRHGNSRSVARLQSAVDSGGEVDGVPLLSPQTIDRIFELQGNGIDLVMGVPLKIGVGYSPIPEGRVCCWGGEGGSLVVIDADMATRSACSDSANPESEADHRSNEVRADRLAL